MKKKVLLLNFEFPPLGGGGGVVAYETAMRLSQTNEYSVTVITSNFPGLKKHEKVNPDFQIFRVPTIRKKREISNFLELLTYLFSAYLFLLFHLNKRKYDICHCHFILPTGLLALLLKIQFHLEYVLIVHGSDVPGYNPERFTIIHRYTKFPLRLICNGAKQIIVLSSYLEKLLFSQIDEYREKTVVIPNGIDTNLVKPMKKKPIILSTGRLLKRKGFHILIQALSKTDLGYELHIAGDGPMMNDLRILATGSKTPVIFHGWMNNKSEEYLDLLGQADIFVLLSTSENSSISLLEAMSAGCAIITSADTGCIELVGEAAISVDEKDVKEVYKKLKELVSNRTMREKFQRAARKRAVERYDWKVIVNKYQEKV